MLAEKTRDPLGIDNADGLSELVRSYKYAAPASG